MRFYYGTVTDIIVMQQSVLLVACNSLRLTVQCESYILSSFINTDPRHNSRKLLTTLSLTTHETINHKEQQDLHQVSDTAKHILTATEIIHAPRGFRIHLSKTS